MVHKAYRRQARDTRRRGSKASISLPTQTDGDSNRDSPTLDLFSTYSPPAGPDPELFSSVLAAETLYIHVGLAQHAAADMDLDTDMGFASTPSSEVDLSTPSLTDLSNFLSNSDSEGNGSSLAAVNSEVECPTATPSPNAYGWDAEYQRRLAVDDGNVDGAYGFGVGAAPPDIARSNGRKTSLLQRVLSVGSNGSLGRRMRA